MKGVELFVIVLVIATALGAVGYMLAPSGISGLQTFNAPPTQVFASAAVDVLPYTLNLNEAFFDSDGETLSYAVDDSAVVLSENTLMFSIPANFAGDYTITITVSDGTNTIAKPFTFVVPGQSAPETTSQPTQEAPLRGNIQSEPASISPPSTANPTPPVSMERVTSDSGKSISVAFDYCPIQLNDSSTLTTGVTSTTDCVTFNADNIELDCLGNTITYGDGGTGVGVSTSGFDNVIVRNCIIQKGAGVAGSNTALNIGGSDNAHILDNTIETHGAGSNQVILGSGTGVRVSGNIIDSSTATGLNNHGLRVSGSNNNFTNNTIITGGTDSLGIIAEGTASNVRIEQNVVNSSGRGIQLSVAGSGNNITNNTIISSGGINNFIQPEGIRIEGGSISNRIISNSVISTGTNGITLVRTSAGHPQITDNIITGNVVNSGRCGIAVDQGGTNCISGLGITVAQVSHLLINLNNVTMVGGNSGTLQAISVSGGGGTNNATIEDNIVQSNGTGRPGGIRIGKNANDSIVRRNIIRTNGTGGADLDIGINLGQGSRRLLITNNSVDTDGPTLQNWGISTDSNVHDSNITDNVIHTHGGSTGLNTGIKLNFDSGNFIVRNNTITTSGVGGANFGIELTQESQNHTVVNNTISTSQDSFNLGIRLRGSANNNTIDGNVITTNGTYDNVGIFIDIAGTNPQPASYNMTVKNNRITTNGTENNTGLRLASGGGHLFVNNTISAGGTGIGNHGASLDNDDGNRFENNTFTAASPLADSLHILNTDGTILTGNTFLAHNYSSIHLIQSRNTNISSSNISNGSYSLLVNETNGAIAYLDSINLTSTINISTIMSITFNRSFVNTTNPAGTPLNKSAQLFFLNLAFFNVTPVVDENDTGVYITCASPRCDLDSYNTSTGVAVVNVSRFTAYALSGNSSSNLPVYAQNPILNSTTGTGALYGTATNAENLTVFFINATDAENDSIQNITDWRINGTSIAVLNLPFESNVSSLAAGGVNDYSMSDNGATLGGGSAAASPVWQTGSQVGGAYFFDGSNDLMTVANSASLDITGNISIEMWVYGNTLASFSAALMKTSTDNWDDGYGMYFDSGTMHFFVDDYQTDALIAMTVGTWNHIVGTYNGTHLRIFRNGTEGTPATFTAPFASTTAPVEIGRGRNDAYNWHGTLDEVRIYNRALTPEQVNQLYLDGAAHKHSESVVSQELHNSDIWTTAATPNDAGTIDGSTLISNSVTISAGFSPACPYLINETTTMDENLTCPATAFIFNADNIVLECAGFSINHSNTAQGYGINATGRSNITIRNCNAFQGNLSIISAHAILWQGTNNSVLTNNTVTGNTSIGLYLISSMNNTLTNNTATSSNDDAILLISSENNTLSNNNGTGNIGVGLYLTTGSNNNVLTNNIGASTSNGALRLEASSNNQLTNNEGISGSAGGLVLAAGAANNTLTNNIAASNTGNALRLITSAQNNTATNTTINANTTWIFADDTTSGNNITNTTFNGSSGSIKIVPTITIPTNTTVSVAKLNITFNNSFLNSTNLSFLNTTGEITLNSIPFTNPRVVVDYEDDGTYVTCSSPTCNETSYSAGVFVFNVSHFTSYAASENVSCPLEVSSSTTLTQNISCPATAVNINADNLVFNCAGNNISYANSAEGAGINATSRNNVTLQNCNVLMTNPSSSNSPGILFQNTQNSTIGNTALNISGSGSNGILLNLSSSITTANISSTSNDSAGVLAFQTNNTQLLNVTARSTTGNAFFISGSLNVTVANSSANSTSGNGIQLTSSNYGTLSTNTFNGSTGISLASSANNTIERNLAFGGSGIALSSSSQNNLTNNTAAASTSYGIALSSSDDVRLINNTGISTVSGGISASGARNIVVGNLGRSTSQIGLGVSGGSNQIFANNTATSQSNIALYFNVMSASNITNNTAYSDSGTALFLDFGTGNNTYTATILESNATWLFSRADVALNMTNTSFRSAAGKIRYPANFSVPNDTTINQARLNLLTNFTFVNSTLLPFLNTTGEITLNSINFTNPRPVADYEDDGTFAICSSPQCDEVSYTGGVFVFNVSRFTSYAASETTFGPVVINSTDGSGANGNNASDNENLTVFVTTTGAVKNISDWRVNSVSIAVAHLPFEGGSTNTSTKDYSTFMNNGTVQNATWNSTAGFDGRGAYDFNGSNAYIELGNPLSLSGRGPVSISAWVKTTGINGDIVSKFGDADLNDSYVLRVNSAGQAMFSVSSSGFKSANSLSVINNGQYQHVMGVFTGNAIEIYVNGTRENSTAVTGSIDASNATVKIGRGGFNVSGFAGEFFNGTIDEVMIFNRSFSATQVSQYYSDLLTYGTLTTIVSDQTLGGQVWTVNTTPNNGTVDGTSLLSNAVTILGSIVSGTKTDSADPVSNGQQFTYQINTTVTNSTAFNVTVIESYPSGLSFVSSQPTPTSGNNVFALGDLSNTTFSVNVTVLVSTGVTQGYGNVVNISYNDADGYNYSQTVTESTAYISVVTCSSCEGCTSCLANTGAYCRATNAITAINTCINMTADNSTFDCNGFEMNYGTSGGSLQVGVAAANRNNITVKNCIIRDTAAGGSGSVGVNFTNVDNSFIQDNNITTNGTSSNFGVRLTTSSTGNTVQRNNITARGTSFSNYAIYVLSGSNMTLIQHNLLTPTGPTSGAIGVKGETNVFNTTVVNNTIRTSGVGVSNYGVAFDVGSTGNNTVNNNSISTNGTTATSNNVGVRLVGSYNNSVTNNFITTNGTSTNYGITVATSPCDNNTLVNNVIHTNGTNINNDGIRLTSVCQQNLVQRNNITTYGTLANLAISLFTGQSNTTISDNVVFASGTIDQQRGITIVDGVNFNISNNTILTNGTSGNVGILLLRVNHTIIDNNSVQTQGTSGNEGIEVTSNSRNHTITRNNVFANGSSSSNVGFSLQDVFNFNVSNNTIRTNGTSSNHGMFMQRINHTVVDNNSVQTQGTGANSVGIGFNTDARNQTVTRNFIRTNGSSSNYGIEFTTRITNGTIQSNTVYTNGTSDNRGINVITQSHNNIVYNNTVYTSGSAGSNYGIGQSDSNNVTTHNNTVVTFGTGDDEVMFIQRGNDSSVSNNSFVSTGSGGSNFGLYVLLTSRRNNLTNNTINTTGSTTQNDGIRLDNEVDNTLVENNTIYTNGSGNNVPFRMRVNSDNNVIRNNSLFVLGGPSDGLNVLVTSNDNNLSRNKISMISTAAGGTGIYLDASLRNRVNESTIDGYAPGNFSWGIIAWSGANHNIISNNNITVQSTNSTHGLKVEFQSINNTFENNIVTVNGATQSNFGAVLSFNSDNNTFNHNTIRINGSSNNYGVRITSFVNNTLFNDTNISTTGTNSYGLFLGAPNNGGAGNNTFNNTRFVNVSQWASVSQPSNATIFWNTTFETPNGSIRIPNNFTLPGTVSTLTKNTLNIVNNTAFINTTNASALNTSAEITLTGLNASTPRLIFDEGDDSSARYCDSPQCTLASYSSGTLRFNVSSFTSYSSSGNMSVEKNDTPDPVTAGSQLSYTIYVSNLGNDTLINTTAVETYPSDVAFHSSSPAPTTGNNTWSLGNIAGLTSTTINITLNVSSGLANGTVLNNSVNVTFANNEGINTSVVDTENTTVIVFAGLACPYNVTADLTLTADQNCAGTAFVISADNLALDCAGHNIYFDNASTGSDQGITATAHSNFTIKNCFISQAPTATNINNRQGILTLGSRNFTINNNTIRVNSTTVGNGMLIQSDSSYPQSRDVLITNNTIIVNGTSNQNRGIHLISVALTNTVANVTISNNSINTRNTDNGGDIRTNRAANITVEDNILLSNGSSFFNSPILSLNTNAIHVRRNDITFGGTGVTNGAGVDLDGSVSNSTVVNNSIFTLGAGGRAFGVRIEFSSRNNTIFNNTIRTGGGAENNYGITVTQEAQNNTISHNSIITNGTTNNIGVRLRFASGPDTTGNIVQDNIIVTDGTSTDNYGIMLEGVSNNTFVNNSIRTIGTGRDHGISIFGAASNSTFDRNVITTASTQSYAIAINGSNFIQFANTRLVNNARWINKSTASSANFTNTSFETTQGIILLPTTISITGFLNATENNLNTTLNRSFLNSTNLSPLNASGIITLNGLGFTDPQVVVDYEDDGTFAVCASPTCNETSYAGGVFVFNVSSFTSYAASETVNASACPLYVNTNTTLGVNITCPATAVVVNASNVELDCAGYTINYSGASTGNGIIASDFRNVTIKNCIITQADNTVNSSNGITFTDVNQSTITNTSIATYGNFSHAYFATASINNTLSNNSIFANGSAGGIAYFIGTSQDNTLVNSTIYNTNIDPAINIVLQSHNNSLVNLTISAIPGQGIYVQDSNRIAFTNLSINSNAASAISIHESADDALSAVTAKSNVGSAIYMQNVNSTNITNTTVTSPTNGFDLKNMTALQFSRNSGSGTSAAYLSNMANSTVSSNVFTSSINNGIYLETASNVTIHNNTLSGGSNPLAVASGVNLTIVNNTATGGTTSSISLNGVNNSAVRDNFGSATAGGATGILVFNSQNTSIFNNTGQSTAASGIFVSSVVNITVNNNTGTSTSGTGILITASAPNSIISRNLGVSTTSDGFSVIGTSITIHNNTGNSGTSNGILLIGVNSSNISNNYATSGFVGFDLLNTYNSRLENNSGYSSGGFGFVVSGGVNNTFTNSSGTVVNDAALIPTSAAGVGIARSENNTFRSTYATANNSLSLSILNFGSPSIGNQFVNITLQTNNSWILVDPTSTVNSIMNTTFLTLNGYIVNENNITLPPGINVSQRSLNISANSSFINTTNHTYFNTTARTALYGVAFIDPRAVVDVEDDGTFVNCDTPECSEVSYASGVFVFNVSHFTSYAASEFVNASVCPLYVNTNTTLGVNIDCPATAVVFNVSNAVLDCAGYNITYAANATGYGVNAGNKTNVTIRNCDVRQTNASISSATGITLDGSNQSTVVNTSVITNGNTSVALFVTGQSNNLTNNSLATSGTASHGVHLAGNPAQHNTLSSSASRVSGTAAHGVRVSGSNNTVRNVTSTSTGAGVALLLRTSDNSTITNNTFIATGTSDGAYIQDDSDGNTLSQNSIVAAGVGIQIWSGPNTNNTIANNTIVASANGVNIADSDNNTLRNNTIGSFGSITVSLTTANNNTITNNSINGSTLANGIHVQTSSSSNLISNNIVWGTVNGLIMQTGANNNNTVLNNTVNASASGITPTSAYNNTFAGNRVQPGTGPALNSALAETNNYANNTFTGGTTWVVFFQDGANNNTFVNNTLNIGGANIWMQTGAAALNNTLGNTTFNMTLGSVLTLNSTLPNASVVALGHFNVSANNSFLNSTNLSFLNTSAQITLRGLTLSDPRPVSDFEDDGTFVNCNPPTCIEISFAGGVYVFNVSHFTSYAAQENSTFVINVSADKLDSPDPVARGSQLSYQIVLNNTGNASALNVTVVENYPSGVVFVSGQPTPIGNGTFNVGNLTPGASFIVNITVNVSNVLANGTVLNNTVNVTFVNSSGENSSFNESELTTVLGAPVLVSIKSDTPDPVVKGTQLNYSILVNNMGDDTAFNVSLTETYPIGVTLVTTQPAPSSGNNTFAIGTLLPNQSFLVNITVTVGSNVANGTILTNNVNASFRNSSGQQGTANDSETTTVLGIATVTVVKTDTPDPVNNGSVLSYTITVTNTGDEIAYNVTAVDGYPFNVSLTTTSPAPTSGNDTFTLGDLLPGASTTINITVTVDPNMTTGVLNNSVNVTFTNVSGVNVTTNAFQATTVTTPGVPATPSAGGGGGGGTVHFNTANITREQIRIPVPISFPTAAPNRNSPAPRETPQTVPATEKSASEQESTYAGEQTTQTSLSGESTSTKIAGVNASTTVIAVIVLAIALLLGAFTLLKTSHPAHPAHAKPAPHQKQTLFAKPTAKPAAKPTKPAKITKPAPKPALAVKSKPALAHDLKKLNSDVAAINKMLREFDKKLKK